MPESDLNCFTQHFLRLPPWPTKRYNESTRPSDKLAERSERVLSHFDLGLRAECKMNYRSELKRFLNQRVCVQLWGRNSVWGKLASVHDDHICLLDTIVVEEMENDDWFERMQYSDEDAGHSRRNAETIIRLDVVLHVTLAEKDDQFPDDSSEPNSPTNYFEGEDQCSKATPKSTQTIVSRLLEIQQTTHASAEEFDQEKPPLSIVANRLEIDLGIGLIPLAEPKRHPNLLDDIGRVRRQIADGKGVIIPKTRVRDCLTLQDANSYQFRIHGHIVSSGTLMIDHVLALDFDDSKTSIEGVDTIEPAYDLPAKWLPASQKEQLTLQGFTVVDPATVLVTHFDACVRQHLHHLISYQDVCSLLESLKEEHGDAIVDLLPNSLSIHALHRLLKSLLEEKISIRNLMPIIESTAYHLNQTGDRAELLQRVRVDIGTDICTPLVGEEGRLNVFQLEESVEKELAEQLTNNDPLKQQADIVSILEKHQAESGRGILLVRLPAIRRAVFEFAFRSGLNLAVLAEPEVPLNIKVARQNC